MPDEPFLANEEQYPWEQDRWDEGQPARIRNRVLVSQARTPSSGVSMGVFEVPPGAGLRPHHHHPPEVYYVVEGEAEVLLDGEWRPLRKGDVVYHPADAIHGVRNRGESTCAIAWIFPTDSYEDIPYVAD